MVTAEAPDAGIHVQMERRGTAPRQPARHAIEAGADDILVLFGDSPFISGATMAAMREALAGGAAIVVCGMRPEDPSGYGRLVMEGDRLIAIRESGTPPRRNAGSASATAASWRFRRARARDPRRDLGRQRATRVLRTDAVEIAHARASR